MKFLTSLKNKVTVTITVIILASLLIFLSTKAIADMFGLFKKYDVHLSPEVRGLITINGEPISDAKVIRTLSYADEIVDYAEVDNDGVFFFPEKNIKSRRPGQMFDESRVFQTIELTYQEKEYLLWYTVTDGEKYQNISDKLQMLNCELSNPEEKVHFKNLEHPSFTHNVISICRWSSN